MFDSLSATQRRRVIAGGALVIIGLFVFAMQFLPVPNPGVFLLAGLALIFGIWGILTRQAGFFVPAGVLGGIVLGVALLTTSSLAFTEVHSAAVMMFSMAIGFAMISVLAYLFTRNLFGWALVVAGVLAFVGGVLWFGGPEILAVLATTQVWSIVLVLVGIGILWRAFRHRSV